MDAHQQGNESPPVRSTILGNLLRGRRQSQSHERETSPDPPSPSMPQAAGGGFSQMLRRRRSGGLGGAAQPSSIVPASPAPSPTTMSAPVHPNGSIALASGSTPSSGLAHRIRLVPHLDSRRSLKFDAITRDVREGDQPVRIGRFTERSNPATAAHANATTSGKVAFKSKVVSRTHAEVWVEAGGKFYIRDTKSSSGTFLNHLRLSPANTESAARPLRDGDILQLGVDYQGGTEDIYKSVKIRVEVGREWQGHKNVFNTSALKNLKSLATPITPGKTGNSNNIPDCCICLFAVTIRQALFIAPCSHTFHYKCIRPLLESHHPAFSCPLCRTFADLDEDVEVEIELDVVEESEPEDEPIAVDVAGKQKQREERERERERDAGAETEVETDVHRDVSASRRRSRMEMMEEEEDRFNSNTWIMDADAGSSGEAVGGPTVITHVGGGDEDVVMHVEDKNARESVP